MSPIECSFYLSIIVVVQTQEADRLHLLAPSAIWQESRFKQVYLQFLGQNYLTGITDFIKTFVHTNQYYTVYSSSESSRARMRTRVTVFNIAHASYFILSARQETQFSEFKVGSIANAYFCYNIYFCYIYGFVITVSVSALTPEIQHGLVKTERAR